MTHRNVVYQTIGLTAEELENGYWWAYKEFYSWSNILKGSMNHDQNAHKLKHLFYSGGWKKFEAVWNFLIKTKSLNNTLPALETVLAKIHFNSAQKTSALPNILENSELQQIVNLNS